MAPTIPPLTHRGAGNSTRADAENNVLRCLAASFIAAILTCAPTAAHAQTLTLPLSGQRHRLIHSDTLFHTLFEDFFLEDDGTTYVQTGDIPAMWLRDSSAQTIPYIRFQIAYPILRGRIVGVIERDARSINLDPYANAFDSNYSVWERKWEIDSLAWPVVLASVYWRTTHDRKLFTTTLHDELRTVVKTYACEERHWSCSTYRWSPTVPTHDLYNPNTGMIWGAFRPSDDPVEYRFNIPQNMFAVVALRALAQLARQGYNDAPLAAAATALAARVQVGIERFGKFFNAQRGVWMYAYETDGYGRYNLMDDANIPNLTTMPYIGWCSAYNPIYLNTRAFTLSDNNPWYFTGTYAAGLGSPHTPYGFVWPLGIIGRALTATSSLEVSTAVTTLAQTDSENGLIHESFYPNGYWQFTRAEFGWANALYAELIFRSVAGFPAMGFAPGGPVVPFEHYSSTPTLVLPMTQIDNTAELFGTLGRLLNEDRAQAGASY